MDSQLEGSVTTVTANRYAGACKTCGRTVPAEAGELRKQAEAWVVYHVECLPAPSPGWHTGLLGSFDTETTGTDPFAARLVSAAFVTSAGGRREFLVDPGVEIPAEATAVHGISTEQARTLGARPQAALDEIAALLAGHLAAGAPLIVFNAPFDLTLLEAELARHGLEPLGRRAGAIRPVVDPLLIDRTLDKYRKGSRTLEAQCAHYGVTIKNAHDACADAVAAMEVAKAQAAKFSELAEASLADLHDRQVVWSEASERDYAAYRARRGESHTPQVGWPVRVKTAAAAAVPGQPSERDRVSTKDSSGVTAPPGTATL
ncbi:MAG TPA: exonuclease domain-containing protein [Actinocrinis sp.]|jgi:DNA polymerase-3 subunit epsilon